MVSPWLIALFGQAGSQTSQLTHNSLIFSDIRMYCRVEAPVPVEPAPAMASLLAGFHEHVFDTGGADCSLDPLVVGGLADEQDAHAFHRIGGNTVERRDHQAGHQIGRAHV